VTDFVASRSRYAARLIARSPLYRRVEAAELLGADRSCAEDPLWQVLDSERDAHGITCLLRTCPLGVVVAFDPSIDLLADLLLAGNAIVAVRVGGTGPDIETVRATLMKSGLPFDAVQETSVLPDIEVDALVAPEGEVIHAERVGTRSHLYVDEHASRHNVPYVCMNALGHNVVDAIVLHASYPQDAANDLLAALRAAESNIEVRTVSSLCDAAVLIDTASSGHVETVLTENLRAARDFVTGVDARRIVVNASPAFGARFTEDLAAAPLPPVQHRAGLASFMKTRWTFLGTGQSLPL